MFLQKTTQKMPSKNIPLFFDTVVLSNFASISNGISFLVLRYGERGYATLQVLEEIAKTIYLEFNYFEEINNSLFVKDGFKTVSLETIEYSIYLSLLRNLGSGEASCIAMAEQRGGVVVTDDRLARNICKERNIPVTGTIGILKAAYLDSFINLDQADAMLKKMINIGFYSPVQRISDTLS